MSNLQFNWTGLGGDGNWESAANWYEPGQPDNYVPTSPQDNTPPSSGPWTADLADISGATVTGSGGADQLNATDVVLDGSFTFGFAGSWGWASSITGTLEIAAGGSVTQATDEALSTGATLQVDANAVYVIAWGSIFGGASFNNDGTVVVEGNIQSMFSSNGSDISEGEVSTPFANNGTLTIDAGDRFLLGPIGGSSPAGSSFGGTIDGAGTLELATTATLDPTSLTVATLDLEGNVTLGENLSYGDELYASGALDLAGDTLTLTGTSSQFVGTIDGGGKIDVTGAANIMPGFALGASSDSTTTILEDAGAITNSAGIAGVGDVLIDALATYTLTNTIGVSSNTIFVNNGTFVDADPTDGNSSIGNAAAQVAFTSYGTLTVDAGDTLTLADQGTLDGVIDGAGTLIIQNASPTLDATSLTVAALTVSDNNGAFVTLEANQSYGGVLTLEGGNGNSGTIDLNGYTFTLSGQSDVLGGYFGGAIEGAGKMLVTGSAIFASDVGSLYINAGSTLEDAGSLTAAAIFRVGGELLVDSSGTFSFTQALAEMQGGGVIVNNGMFVDAGAGISEVEDNFTNTGKLTVDAGDILDLYGDAIATLGGAIGGAGTLRIDEAATLSVSSLTVATLDLFNGAATLGANISYGGAFSFNSQQAGGTLALSGYTLTLSGNATFYGGGDWGGGEILIAGEASFNGSADTSGQVYLGSRTGTLLISGQATVNGEAGLLAAVELEAGGSLTLTSGTYAGFSGSDIVFAGANATLTIDQWSAGVAPLSGLGLGDTIDLIGVTANGASVNSSDQLVVTENGTVVATLQLAGDNSGLSFALIASAANTEIIALPDPATVNDYLTEKADYDVVAGGFAIGDGASAIVANLAALDLDSHITAINILSGSATLKAGAVATVANLSESGAGTALTIAENLSYAGAFSQGAGSRLVVDNGDALTLSGTGSLAGATSGGGALALTGGDTTFAAGATLATSAWSLSGPETTATLGVTLTYTATFSTGAGTQLALSGGGLTLKGATTLAGVTVSGASPDNLNLYGATSVSGLTIAGDGMVVNAATATQSGGSINVGDGVSTDKAELYNAATGVWNIADDSGVARGADAASVIANLGLLEKTGGNATSTVAVSMADTGSVAAASGTLAFAGPSNSFAGAISGSGTVLFSGGASTLKAGAVATVTNLSESGAGTALTIAENLSYAGAFTQGAGSRLVVDSGDALTLSGTGSLAGATSGGGALALTGGDTTFAAGATLATSAWSLSGPETTATLGVTLTYTGTLSAGAGTQLALSGGGLTLKGATTLAGVTVSGVSPDNLNLYGATSVSGLTIAGDGMVVNAATATQSGGSINVGDGVSTDKAELYNAATGVWNIADDSGVARGADAASVIANLGLLEKTGGNATSTVAVSMADTGSVATASGTLAFAGPSNSFAGAISGSGTILFSGGASTLKAGAVATVANLSESGAGTALTIAENLSYAGAFTQGAGSRLVVDSGDALTLSGTGSLAGATSGGGALALTGGDTTFAAGATLATSAWSLSGPGTTATLGVTLTYTATFSAGAGTQLALSGGGLTLKGATTLAGVTVSGASPDNLNLYGATSVSGLTIAGDGMVVNAATATQSGGSINVGDGVSTDKAELYNAATGVWNIADDSGVARGADAASVIANLGLLEKTGGNATSMVATAVTNSGRILAASGVLDFQAAVTGTGADTLSGASTLEFNSTAAAGQTIGFTGSGSTLLVGSLQNFSATLSGYDIGGAGGTSDVIQLVGAWTETGFSENAAGTLGTLTLFNGTVHESLKFAGDYTSASFHVNQSGGDTVIN